MGLGILHKQCADKNIGSKAQRNYAPFSSDSSISGVSPARLDCIFSAPAESIA
jgi:hypothetical protein